VITQDQIDEWEESESYYSKPDPIEILTPMDMVQEFAEVTEQQPTPSLYVKLIGEELDEWAKEGMIRSENDLKELADLVYVIYGYANAMGYDLDTAVRRVHESNITRVIHEDGKVYFREDGKAIKNPNAKKVDLNDLI